MNPSTRSTSFYMNLLARSRPLAVRAKNFPAPKFLARTRRLVSLIVNNERRIKRRAHRLVVTRARCASRRRMRLVLCLRGWRRARARAASHACQKTALSALRGFSFSFCLFREAILYLRGKEWNGGVFGCVRGGYLKKCSFLRSIYFVYKFH